MKNLFFIAVAATVLFAFSSVVSAQEEQKMKFDDWQKEIATYTAKRDSLKNVLDKLNQDIANLKNQLAGLDADYQKELQNYYSLLQTSKQEMDSFAQKLDQISATIDGYMKMSDQDLCAHRDDVAALQNQLNDLKASKLHLAAEFYSKYQTIMNNYADLQARIAKCSQVVMKTYTVGTWAKNRDCLWNIAKKKTIYDDPWKWPKIYVENRDEIKNPDLIYPKQVLKIPENGPLTDREKAAAKAYYAKKARAEKAVAEKANKPAETH